MPTVYNNSFESGPDFPSGWTTYTECGGSSATRYAGNVPRGGGGSFLLLTNGAQCAGAANGAGALSPPFSVTPGKTYRVDGQSANGSNIGTTSIVFYDSTGTQMKSLEQDWSPDTNVWNADTTLYGVAPAGAVTGKVLLVNTTASSNAGYDLLRVTAINWGVALPSAVSNGYTGATITHNGLVGSVSGTHQSRFFWQNVKVTTGRANTTTTNGTYATWPTNQTATAVISCVPTSSSCTISGDLVVESRMETSPGVYEISQSSVHGSDTCFWLSGSSLRCGKSIWTPQ
jgi:hypothetical protein